jgi:hypothetical protein
MRVTDLNKSLVIRFRLQHPCTYCRATRTLARYAPNHQCLNIGNLERLKLKTGGLVAHVYRNVGYIAWFTWTQAD